MILFFIAIISFFPVLLWAYIFSYIDWDKLNKKRFFMWIFSWILWVLPIIYYEKIFSFFKLNNLLQVFDSFNLFHYFFLLLIFFIFIFIVSTLYSFLFKLQNKQKLSFEIKSFFTFLIFTFLFSLLLFFLNFIWIFSWIWTPKNLLWLNWVWISSFIILLFYYLFIALIEEFSKFINFLWTSFAYINSIKKGIFYSFFVSLWFVFIENILYLYNFYLAWEKGTSLLYIYFSRSIFSLSLHLFCWALIVFYFSKALLKFNKFNFNFFVLLFLWIFLWVFNHWFYDILIEYWFTYTIIIYFLIAYFYITSIFFKN